jgi:hypothetical protein
LEHRSWEIDRRLDGWRPGTPRDDRARIHPALIPYGELPDHVQEFDRDQIRTVSSLLQRDDAPRVKRECRLGILGHNRISRDEKALMLRKLETFMLELVHTHRLDFVSVCTPLAPGSDTILTERVLKALHEAGIDHRLIVVRALPVSTVIEDFEASFSNESEWRLMDSEPSGDWSEVKKQIADHLAMVAKTTRSEKNFVADLTPPGLAVDDFQNDEEQRTLAYRRAGAWLAEKSDVLIAYHDPKRSSGPGGTRETLQWAQNRTSIPADLSTLRRGKKKKAKKKARLDRGEKEKATTPRMMIIEP